LYFTLANSGFWILTAKRRQQQRFQKNINRAHLPPQVSQSTDENKFYLVASSAKSRTKILILLSANEWKRRKDTSFTNPFMFSDRDVGYEQRMRENRVQTFPLIMGNSRSLCIVEA
jgi:hypothetical protein